MDHQRKLVHPWNILFNPDGPLGGTENSASTAPASPWDLVLKWTMQWKNGEKLKSKTTNCWGKTRINHPQITIYRWYKQFPDGWFIIVLPTLPCGILNFQEVGKTMKHGDKLHNNDPVVSRSTSIDIPSASLRSFIGLELVNGAADSCWLWYVVSMECFGSNKSQFWN